MSEIGMRHRRHRKVRIVRFSQELLAEWLTKGTERPPSATTEGLPSNCVLVGVTFDGRTLICTWQHDSFEPVPEDQPIPEIVVVLKSHGPVTYSNLSKTS